MGNKQSNRNEPNVDMSILTEEKIISLMENTSFKREEIVKWHEGFIRDCPKGQLNKKKFIEVYKVFYPHGKADKFCSLVFKVFDCDNSGYIDFTELLIAISITAQGDACKKLTLAFKMVSLVILIEFCNI
jgi:neuronal calcium sensor 1